VMIPDGGVTNG